MMILIILISLMILILLISLMIKVNNFFKKKRLNNKKYLDVFSVFYLIEIIS